jgi:putative copper resistance protein D
MMLAAALVGSRLLHYACLTALFGATAFVLYAAWGWGPPPQAWIARLRVFGLTALSGAVVSGLLWFLCTAAGMGEPGAALDPKLLQTVLVDSPFGWLWAARLVVAAATASVLVGLRGRGGAWLAAMLSALLLGSLALTGHAQSEEGAAGVLHALADAVHLLTAGVWIGGLFALAFVVGRTGRRDEPPIGTVLADFSGVGYTAVALLLLTGLMNSFFLLGAPSALWTTGYGRTLSVKLALTGGMLALALVNRFWISPALARTDIEPAVWLARLKRHILAEQVLGGLVLGAVALLGALDPGA